MNLNIDIDWLMRFYDSVGCTSNDVLQDLWAKILAGEINHPNSCSLRTLDILKNVTEKEARVFEKLCKFIARCEKKITLFLMLDFYLIMVIRIPVKNMWMIMV